MCDYLSQLLFLHVNALTSQTPKTPYGIKGF